MKTNRLEALSFTAKHGFIRTGRPYTSRSSRHVTFEEPVKRELIAKTSTNTNSDTESTETPTSTRDTNGAVDTKERRVTKNLMRKKKRSKSLSRSMDEELLRSTLDQKTEDPKTTGATNGKKVRTGKAKRKGKTKEKSENGDADELHLNLNIGVVASDDEDENVSFDPNLVVPRLDLSGLDQSVTPRSILRLV